MNLSDLFRLPRNFDEWMWFLHGENYDQMMKRKQLDSHFKDYESYKRARRYIEQLLNEADMKSLNQERTLSDLRNSATRQFVPPITPEMPLVHPSLDERRSRLKDM